MLNLCPFPVKVTTSKIYYASIDSTEKITQLIWIIFQFNNNLATSPHNKVEIEISQSAAKKKNKENSLFIA